LEEPLSSAFEGVVRLGDPDRDLDGNPELSESIENALDAFRASLNEALEGREEAPATEDVRQFAVRGRIELRPIAGIIGPAVAGRLTGNILLWNPESNEFDKLGEPIELDLSSVVGRFEIDRKIYADQERPLRIDVVDDGEKDRPQKIGVLRGTIERPLSDWFAVPLESEKLGRLHSRLGKTYDLALVYTWIASLLNVLVLWDAFEGPAYGFGDEKPEKDDEAKDGKTKTSDANPPPSNDKSVKAKS